MRPDDLVRLKHMQDATASALRFVDGRSRQDLDSDEILLFAPVRADEVIGEVASKVSAAGRTELPEIRWAAIVGMRNRLVHAHALILSLALACSASVVLSMHDGSDASMLTPTSVPSGRPTSR